MKKIAALFIICIMLSGCGASVGEARKETFMLNTAVAVTVYSENAEQDASDVLTLCNSLENTLSRTIDGSDIYKINNSPGGGPVNVSDETVFLLKESKYYSAVTNGCFDVTIGAVSALWDFSGQDPENPMIPRDDDIEVATETIGSGNIDIEGNTVTVPEGTKLDLGAIAKGYIADKMAGLLVSRGASGLINLGGDIVTVGEKPDGTLYTIGIRSPMDDGVVASLKAPGGVSVVTSGDYERTFYYEGKLYHHILDPKTGYPAVSDLRSVTIISENGAAQADALSTGAFVLGLAGGRALIEGIGGVEAVFVTADGTVTYTTGARERYEIMEN